MPSDRPTYPELIWISLKMGFLAFGGAAPTLALLEDELAHRRQWTTKEQILESFALCKLLPGSSGPQTVASTGYHLRGLMGGVLMAAAYLFPCALIAVLLTIGVVSFGKDPYVAHALKGVSAAAIGLILAATYRLGLSVLRSATAWTIAVLGLVIAIIWNADAALIVLGGCLAGVALERGKTP